MSDLYDDEDDLLSEIHKKGDDLDEDLDDEALLYDSDGPDDNILDFSPPAKFMQQTAFDFESDDLVTDNPKATEEISVNLETEKPAIKNEVIDNCNEISDFVTKEEKLSPVKRHSVSIDEEQREGVANHETTTDDVDTKRRRLSSDVPAMQHQISLSDQAGDDQEEDNVVEDEDSDGEDDNQRNRFRSERDVKETIKPARSNMNEKREIPDTLEISDEARQKIEDFDKQQQQKRFNRQNRRKPYNNRGKGNMRGGIRMAGNNFQQMRAHGKPPTLMSLPMPFRPMSQAGILGQPSRPVVMNPLLQNRPMPPNLPLLPPWEAIRLLGPPPPMIARTLQIPPPQLQAPPPQIQALLPQIAAPVSTAPSTIPVISGTKREASAEQENGVAGNPIPTLMTGSQRVDSPKNEADDLKKGREVVYGGTTSDRTSPKLSVKISRSRSRSQSPLPRSSHKRTVIRPHRSRSPRSHSRSRRSPTSRKKSRRHSRSVSPKRHSFSPTRSRSPKHTKPAKIHINPHFKGPRSFPSEAKSSASATVVKPTAPSIAAPQINPAIPPPPISFPPPPLPNPTVRPPPLPVPTPAAPAVVTTSTARPIIPIPPPVLPLHPGVKMPPPPIKPINTSALPGRPAGNNTGLPLPLPINTSVPPPAVPRTPTPASIASQVRPPLLQSPTIVRPLIPRQAAPLNISRPPTSQPQLQPSAGTQPILQQRLTPPGGQPVALIRPSFVDNNPQQQFKPSNVRNRLGPKSQTQPANTQTTTSNSRLKPPPSSAITTQPPAQNQIWDMSNQVENEKYKALIEQQAARRKEILARKSRKRGPAGQTQPVTLLPTPTVVQVTNLASETKISSVERLMNSVAPVTEVTYDGSQHAISGKFKSRDAAEAFTQKFNRYMLDLSYITVKIM